MSTKPLLYILLYMLLAMGAHASPSPNPQTSLSEGLYTPPSLERDLPPGKLGETIRYGHELLSRLKVA